MDRPEPAGGAAQGDPGVEGGGVKGPRGVGIRSLIRQVLRPYRRRRRRLSQVHDEWSIGILTGSSPFALRSPPDVANPVLTRREVIDRRAAFVADPFLLRRGGNWFLFFEVYGRLGAKGEIALATSSDGRSWRYQRIVLTEPFHLSYPYVFEWGGEMYMVPESYKAGQVRLYRARSFPHDWEFVGPLLEGGTFIDPSIFRHSGQWWLLAETNPDPMQWDTLGLFRSDVLQGPWEEHPGSPVSVDPNGARPAGRLLRVEDRLFRLGQVCEPDYGTALRAFEILELTPDRYQERENRDGIVLGPEREEWRSTGVHHLDAQRLEDGSWIAVVDGCGRRASGVEWVPRSEIPHGSGGLRRAEDPR